MPQRPTVSGTGHRPQHLTPTQRLWTRQKAYAAACWCRDVWGTTVGISGLALGFDTWWAEGILDAGLTLGVYVPFPQQADRWPREDRAAWQRLRDAADPAYSRMIAEEASIAALHKRNDEMRNASDAVVTAWKSGTTQGGTWSAVRKAVAVGKPGVWIDPGTLRVRSRLPTREELT